MKQVQRTYQSESLPLSTIVADYLALAKFKLNISVVITSVLGFLFAGGAAPGDVLWLVTGGFLVIASANTINQIIERDFDAMMKRTMNRPLPQKRVSLVEAWLFAGITGLFGVVILWVAFNQLAAVLGALSLFSYAFIYTPLKRIHPISVFVGAIPGALPPMIGYVAAAGVLNIEAVILFTFQFLWQFPHFWAIAWLTIDDYNKANFKVLPGNKRSKRVAVEALFVTLVLIAFSFVPYYFGMTSLWAAILCAIVGVVYALPAMKLVKKLDEKSARQLMFASFLYVPIVFILIILG